MMVPQIYGNNVCFITILDFPTFFRSIISDSLSRNHPNIFQYGQRITHNIFRYVFNFDKIGSLWFFVQILLEQDQDWRNKQLLRAWSVFLLLCVCAALYCAKKAGSTGPGCWAFERQGFSYYWFVLLGLCFVGQSVLGYNIIEKNIGKLQPQIFKPLFWSSLV